MVFPCFSHNNGQKLTASPAGHSPEIPGRVALRARQSLVELGRGAAVESQQVRMASGDGWAPRCPMGIYGRCGKNDGNPWENGGKNMNKWKVHLGK